MTSRANDPSKYRIPRNLKQQLSLQSSGDANRDGEIRRIMIAAHQRRIEVKEKSKNLTIPVDQVSAPEEAVTT